MDISPFSELTLSPKTYIPLQLNSTKPMMQRIEYVLLQCMF